VHMPSQGIPQERAFFRADIVSLSAQFFPLCRASVCKSARAPTGHHMEVQQREKKHDPEIGQTTHYLVGAHEKENGHPWRKFEK
jgi:hypothetical protein